MKELWKEFYDEMEKSAFSLIAARLLHEEITDDMDFRTRIEFTRRHDRHIRASRRHLRKAKRIRTKIKRYDEKQNSHRSA